MDRDREALIDDCLLHGKSIVLRGDVRETCKLVEEAVKRRMRKLCTFLRLPVVQRVELPVDDEQLPVAGNRKAYSAKGALIVTGDPELVKETVETHRINGRDILKHWIVVGVIEEET